MDYVFIEYNIGDHGGRESIEYIVGPFKTIESAKKWYKKQTGRDFGNRQRWSEIAKVESMEDWE